jgi:hypothetical protein
VQSIIRFATNEIPEPDSIPSDFAELMAVGRKDAEIQFFGFSWHLYTIEEWERREIVRRLANLDPISKIRLSKVEFLTQSIVEVTRLQDRKQFTFSTSDKKPIIRNILLASDSKVVDELYEAYSLLEEIAQREYDRKYEGVREQMKSSFFGSTGESSELSSLKTQEIQDSLELSEALSSLNGLSTTSD